MISLPDRIDMLRTADRIIDADFVRNCRKVGLRRIVKRDVVIIERKVRP
jgi:hypothetical protein